MFLSLRYLVTLQFIILVAWLAVVQENFQELSYFSTFVAAVSVHPSLKTKFSKPATTSDA